MSKSHKTNAAYRAWKKVKALFPVSFDEPHAGERLKEATEASTEAHRTGRRWGNQRKMRAKMKVDARKSERKRSKRIDPSEH